MTDSRSLARDMLSRVGSGQAPAPVASTATAVAPAQRRAVRRGVRRVEQLPQVRTALERDAQMLEAEKALGAPSPYYRSHRGFNGATINLDGEELVNFSSYNYLGLAGHPRMIAAAKAALDEYGTTTGASRIVSGNIPLHEELEAEIATAYGTEDAIIVGSGFLTNASAISFVLGENDLAMCDELVHNSIVAGTLWSHARRMQFRHNDPDALDAMLRRTRGHFENILVILEGVYSMDGDICALPEMIEVARRHDAMVMVDEAHSFGVLGEHGLGVREHFGLAPDAVDFWMGTMSKTMASHGGFIAGRRDFVQACRMQAPGMSLYAASPAPATTAAGLTALRLMREEPERLADLRSNSELFLSLVREAGLDAGTSAGAPVVPVILGASDRAVVTAMLLARRGVNANPIAYPAVPEGQARLRFFLCADHTEAQLRRSVDALVGLTAEVDTILGAHGRG